MCEGFVTNIEAFIILYFACGIPYVKAAFLQGNPHISPLFLFPAPNVRALVSIAKLERDLGSPHPPFSKIRLFCLERPQGFSGLAPRPLLQLHSQQETCQPTGQRSGVGLTQKCHATVPQQNTVLMNALATASPTSAAGAGQWPRSIRRSISA